MKSLADEILEIIEAPGDQGALIDDFVNRFRGGHLHISEVLSLLESNDIDVISVGAWIVDESIFEESEAVEVFAKLQELLHHENATVRYCALGALYQTFSRQDADTIRVLDVVSGDPDSGVRALGAHISERIFGHKP